jgi:hypothetical protein
VEPRNTSSAGPFQVNAPYRCTLHTTEGGRNPFGAESYHGHSSYPHFEVHEDGFDQFFPLNVASKALAPSDRVKTNLIPNIQIEIVGKAANAQSFSDKLLANLADVCRFIMEQTGVQPMPPPQGFFREGAATTSGALWFSTEEWNRWNGFCGHGNVPDNLERWDPGNFPWERFQRFMGLDDPWADLFVPLLVS